MLTKQTKGALLIGGLALLGVVIAWLSAPYFADRRDRQTSDAGRAAIGEVTMRYDGWAGNFVVCSPHMEELMRQEGIRWNCINDQAKYQERMESLHKGEADFAVYTVDSDILNGKPWDFPATIAAVIDDSYGGDAMYARTDRVKNIDDLKKLKNPKVCFTPDSPSEHVLKVVISNFGINSLSWANKDWQVKAGDNSSVEVLDNLTAGKCDVGVLWEPQTTKARKTPGLVELISTKNMNRTIVDVLVVNDKYLLDHPDIVKMVLSNYFRALKFYKDNEETLVREVAKTTGVQEEDVKPMLEGFRWATLEDNAVQWFGISRPGQGANRWLVESIRSAADILVETGSFSKNPLPDGDPYRLVFSKPIEELYLHGIQGPGQRSKALVNSLEARFPALPDPGWAKLREVGTLKIRPITFLNGIALLDLDGKEQVDKIAEMVAKSPDYRFLITGHTSEEPAYLKGEELEEKRQANIVLSQERADVIAQYLVVTHNVDPNRMKAVGVGSEKPLDRNPSESKRAYSEWERRVEIHLVAESY